MEANFASRIRVSRRRLLPQPGQVLVRVGDLVRPLDIVARAVVGDGIQIVDAAKLLGISRERMDRHIVVSLGQVVESGEALAVRPVLGRHLRRTCRSPITGRVLSASDGYVFLQKAPRALNRLAYLSGEVTEVTPLYGATITGEVAWAQGVWGCGGTAWGPLNVVVSTPEEPLVWERITRSCRGTIVVGGSLLDRTALLRAYRFGAVGLVVGGVDPGLLHSESGSWPVPVVITEGAGRIPMASPIFELLLGYHERPATIRGGEGEGWETRRPELLIPLERIPQGPVDTVEAETLQRGDVVRLTQSPDLAQIGAVSKAQPPDVRFRPGLSGSSAEVPVCETRENHV